MARRGYPDGIVRYPVSVSQQEKDGDGVQEDNANVVELDSDLTVSDVGVDDGCDVTIVYVNKGSEAVSVTVPHTAFTTPDGEDINIVVPAGGYGEVNLLRIGDEVYARGG